MIRLPFIAFPKNNGSGYGNYVVIQHDNYLLGTGQRVTLYSRYSHLGSVNLNQVYLNGSVNKGTVIGWIGSTGSSQGWHLDYQICYGGWSSPAAYSKDPFINELLALPDSGRIDANGASKWSTCCYEYVDYVNRLYSTPSPYSLNLRDSKACDLQATANGTVAVWTLPGNKSTYPNSENLDPISGTFHVMRIVENNANEPGHFWYEMKTASGQTGYVWYKNVSSTSQNWTVKASDINKPVNLSMANGHSQTWPCTGTVTTGGSIITEIQGFIYSGNSVSGTPVTYSDPKYPNSTSFNLSDIDYSMRFNDVTNPGYYTYVIKAKLKSAEVNNGSASEVASGWVVVSDTRSYYHVGNPATEYIIALDSNGGSCSTESIKYVQGNTLGDLPTPTLSDNNLATKDLNNFYYFDGWYNAKTGGTKVTKDTVVNGNMTIYAHWIKSDFYGKISFNTNGGSFERLGNRIDEASSYIFHDYETGQDKTYSSFAAYLADNKYIYSASIGGRYYQLPVPTKVGYLFDGWSDNGYSGPYYGYYFGFAGLNLKASWTPYNNARPAATLTYNNHIYQLYNYHLNWTTAEEFCQSLSGHLVCINDGAEQAKVVELIQSSTDDNGVANGVYHIGAVKNNGSWGWINGDDFNYTAWDTYEPSNSDNELYGAIIGIDYAPNKTVGEWIDEPATDFNGFYSIGNAGFICEIEIPPCAHSYTILDIALGTGKSKSPTLSEAGYFTYICSKCGEEVVEHYPALNGTDYEIKRGEDPTCTETGYDEYTYTGDSLAHPYFTVEIPRIPHNYVATDNPATCTTPASTTYTCSMCSNSYTEFNEDDFSDWKETLPEGIDEILVQSKTQYRFRGKETTTSTESFLEGWTLDSTQQVWGDYDEWSNWSATAVSENNSTIVETRTAYGWYYFECPNCHAHMHGYGTCWTWCGGCGATTTVDGWHQLYDGTNWNVAQEWHGTGKYTTIINGERWFRWNEGGTQTQYRFRSRTLNTVYTYFRWTDWTDWNETEVLPTDDLEVETRTVYRYIMGPFSEHSWSEWTVTTPASTTQEGVETRTCTKCGATETRTIPMVKVYTVAYNAEGATGVPENQTKIEGESLMLSDLKPIRSETPSVSVTITLNPNGGNVTTTSLTTSGTKSYEFSNWEDDDGNHYYPGSGYTANASVTLHAMWVVRNNVAAVILPTPTREGFDFKGWAQRKTAASGVTGSYTPYVDVTLYAIWEQTAPATYTLSYDANGGTGAPEPQTKAHDIAITIPSTVPTHEDSNVDRFTVTLNANGGSVSTASLNAVCMTSYDFINWNTAMNGRGTSYNPGVDYTANSDVTLYAQWSSNTTVASVNLATPTFSGYIFMGWATDSTATEGIAVNYTPDGNITLYAIWKMDSVQSGTWKDLNWMIDLNGKLTISGSGTMGSFDMSSKNAWRMHKNFISSVEIQPGVMSISDYAFYDCGELKSVEIPSSVSSIGFDSFRSCISLTEITIPEGIPSITSQAFFKCSNLKSVNVPASVTKIGVNAFAECVELRDIYFAGTRAQWRAITKASNNDPLLKAEIHYIRYTVSYDANDGTGAPTNQTKTHDITLTLSSTNPTHASESADSYAITLNANGGSVSPTSLSAARTTSYSFKNWNTAADGSGTSYASGASYTANADVTLYAQWNSNTTTNAVTLPTPTRSGYTFKGWGTSSTASSGVTGSYTPSGNVTLYAIWKLNSFTVTYNANGGTNAPDAQSKTPGVALNVTTARPKYEDCLFLGWAESADAAMAQYQPGDSFTKDADTTLYAVWLEPDFVLPAALTEIGEEALCGRRVYLC